MPRSVAAPRRAPRGRAADGEADEGCTSRKLCCSSRRRTMEHTQTSTMWLRPRIHPTVLTARAWVRTLGAAPAAIPPLLPPAAELLA
jgi:hypothetical protein